MVAHESLVTFSVTIPVYGISSVSSLISVVLLRDKLESFCYSFLYVNYPSYWTFAINNDSHIQITFFVF